MISGGFWESYSNGIQMNQNRLGSASTRQKGRPLYFFTS